MKLFIVLATFVCYLAIALGCNTSTLKSGSAALGVADGRTPQATYTLAQNAKNPKDAPTVPFSHENHATKNYNVAGTGPIACVECHHTDQPAATAAKHPPLKTADPADRTATLTAESIKDAKTPDVKSCQTCHTQEGKKPTGMAAIPSVTYDGDSDPTTLTNEEAFHRNCAGCHDQVVEKRSTAKAPTSQQCTDCHTGKK